jgi:hypothetical protein
LRAVHGQYELVGAPEGEEIQARGEEEREQHAAFAADQGAKRHEQGGQAGQQSGGLQIVHRGLRRLALILPLWLKRW